MHQRESLAQNPDDELEPKVLETLDDSIYSMTFVAMIKPIHQEFFPKLKVGEYIYKSIMIFGIQMVMIVFIIMAAINGEDGLEYV